MDSRPAATSDAVGLGAMPRTLRPGQRAELYVVDVTSGDRRLVHSSSSLLFEAPNWVGDELVVLAKELFPQLASSSSRAVWQKGAMKALQENRREEARRRQ